jgi:hypothetical protein
MNPLLPADFQDSRVHAVPETEDFIAAIGHLATEDEILHLQSEVELSEKDFVDPTLVFEDRGGFPGNMAIVQGTSWVCTGVSMARGKAAYCMNHNVLASCMLQHCISGGRMLSFVC